MGIDPDTEKIACANASCAGRGRRFLWELEDWIGNAGDCHGFLKGVRRNRITTSLGYENGKMFGEVAERPPFFV